MVAQRLIDGARNGAIMLAHDIQPGTIEAAPKMFDTLLAKGFKFVTVSQLLDLAKLEDQVGNERPGSAGDTISDGGARGTGAGGQRAWRTVDGSAAQPPRQNPAPGVTVVRCIVDVPSLKSVQELLIAKGLLTGPAGESCRVVALPAVLTLLFRRRHDRPQVARGAPDVAHPQLSARRSLLHHRPHHRCAQGFPVKKQLLTFTMRISGSNIVRFQKTKKVLAA